VTRVGASERGQRTSFNGAEGVSDIEGKVTRVGASEGMEHLGKSDIEGKAAVTSGENGAAGMRAT